LYRAGSHVGKMAEFEVRTNLRKTALAAILENDEHRLHKFKSTALVAILKNG